MEVLHHAAKCIRAQICDQIGGITSEDYANADRHIFAFGPLKVGGKTNNAKSESSDLVQNISAANITSLMNSVQLKTNNVELQVLL